MIPSSPVKPYFENNFHRVYTLFMAFPSSSMPPMSPVDQPNTSNRVPDPRKKKLLAQIMANQQGGDQMNQLFRLGGSGYADMIQQRMMDPTNTFY